MPFNPNFASLEDSESKVLKAKELKKLVQEAAGEKVDLVKYFTTLEMK